MFKILVVEDDRELNKVVCSYLLRKWGVDFITTDVLALCEKH